MSNDDIFGYFDGPGTVPAHDPGPDAPCPSCGKPVTREGVRTQSILVPGDYRCYFMRYHIACAGDPKIEDAIHRMVHQRAQVADTINEADGVTRDEALARYIGEAAFQPESDAP